MIDMAVRSLFSWPGMLRALYANAVLSWRLLREPRVPIYLKALPVATLLYMISPLDFIPDVIPFIGEIDDVAFIVLTLQLFQRICPAPMVDFHRAAIARRERYSPMTHTDGYIDV